MNYERIYNEIIQHRRNNPPEGYSERHHIIPRSFGGSDELSNIVQLTAREHFICHWLLTKIHPKGKLHYKAMHAFVMMAWHHSGNQDRYKCTSRLYEKLKKDHKALMSRSQRGEKNSQYGLRWIHNQELQKSKKIPKNDPLPIGWEEGRKVTNWKISRTCKQCGIEFKFKNKEQYCSQDCKDKATSTLYGREQEFLKNYDNLGSMNKALKQMGLPGAISYWYHWAKKVLEMRK